MKKVQTDKVAVLGCVHTPYQDEKAVESTLDFLKFWKPNRVILNGDAYDLLPVSKHCKDPRRLLRLDEEVEEGRKFNRSLRKAVGQDCEIQLHQGNHEARWEVFLKEKAPQLLSLTDFSIEKVFALEESQIEYVRGRNGNYARTMVGGVLVGHFPLIRPDSGATAKALVNRYFGSIIAHHSHRMGTYEKNTPNGRFIGQEGGCLCTMEPEYVETPDWSQGFITMERILDKDTFHISPVRIINGRIFYEGKVFE
jgi:hypothetical protein